MPQYLLLANILLLTAGLQPASAAPTAIHNIITVSDGRDLFRVPKRDTFDGSSPYGYWFGEDNFDGAVTTQARLKITEQSMKKAVRCNDGFETIYVAVDVPIRITKSTIEILYGNSQTDSNFNFECTVSIDSTQPMPYRVINGHFYFDGFSSFDSIYEKLSDL